MDENRTVKDLLEEISKNEKYNGCVFWGPGIYFVIGNGKLWEISDDAGCTPRGGWFPDIVSGPSKEEKEFISLIIEEFEIDEDFFSAIIEDYGEFDDEYATEFFEDNEDEESATIYKKIKRKIKSGKTPFKTLNTFVSAFTRYELEADCLYYEWEGEYIDLHDNICETGEERGYYENLSDDEWLEILIDIEKHIVVAESNENEEDV